MLVPLLVLAGLALLGIRAQTQAAWSAAREEAKAILSSESIRLAGGLTAAVGSHPLFPDPPVPGSSAPDDDPLASNGIAALIQLRDDPAAGLSPAGLPRRVLAALRLLDLEPTAQAPDELVKLVTREAPSILTSSALARVAQMAPEVGQPALDRWQQGEQALAIWRPVQTDGWHPAANGDWWLRGDGRQLTYLTPEALRAALAAQARQLPPWAGLELRAGDRRLVTRSNMFGESATPPDNGGNARTTGGSDSLREASTASSGEVLASGQVEFGADLHLDIVAASPSWIEREVRRQARWTLSLLALAVGVSAAALGLIHRIVRQERRLGALKSQFVSSVSHELRAPVSSIRLMAEALHAGKVTGEAAAEFHRLIPGEGARLSHLVENVLDFARIEEGRKRYRFEETDLRQLTAEVVRLLDPLAAECGVTLHATLADCTATVDPAALQQAVVNLLDNAIKFSPSGATVTIDLTAGANGWSLAVRDEGPGIPAAEHERIFERFYRLGNELRRETQGTGIGLSIVKHIIEAHGGSVAVASKPGQGSRFIVEVLSFKCSVSSEEKT